MNPAKHVRNSSILIITSLVMVYGLVMLLMPLATTSINDIYRDADQRHTTYYTQQGCTVIKRTPAPMNLNWVHWSCQGNEVKDLAGK